MRSIWTRLRELRRYPSGVAGLLILAVLVVVSVATVIAIPHSEAIRLWRGSEGVWLENPRHAWPKWINLLPGVNRPETIVLRSGLDGTKTMSTDGETVVTIALAFDYPYDGFPKEIHLFFTAQYVRFRPYASVRWRTPDGREIPLLQRGVSRDERYIVAADAALKANLGISPEIGLFREPAPPGSTPTSQKGRYELTVEAFLFEPDADLDVKLVVYGQVHGWAGTDHLGRDLALALLWGTPIALVFGFVAAVGITFAQFTSGALAAWYGRSVDAMIGFWTKVEMVTPNLPIYMMIALFLSRSIWVTLGAVVVFNLFGGGVLSYRSMFLQVKESAYVEAARAYGASSLRIVFRYLMPRVLPVLIPGFVSAIPAFVFLEAGLAFLGLGDPSLPTWGKVLNESGISALLQGHYYWVLQPAALLVVTGFAFALIGFSLDRIFNPRLRTI